MSRVIKFRAWIRDEGSGEFKMISGDTLAFEEYRPLVDHLEDVEGYKYLMQFTGLHDKNGNEIYEGDIILEGITRKIIVWENGAFHVRVPNYEPGRDLPTRPLCFDMLSPDGIRFEIIGNIYQNPELTKA